MPEIPMEHREYVIIDTGPAQLGRTLELSRPVDHDKMHPVLFDDGWSLLPGWTWVIQMNGTPIGTATDDELDFYVKKGRLEDNTKGVAR